EPRLHRRRRRLIWILPRNAGEVASRASRRGPRRLRPLPHAPYGPPPPLAGEEPVVAHPFNSAAITRSRVIGRSRTRAPSACATALPTAATVGPPDASPMPSGGLSVCAPTSSTKISGTSLNLMTG